MRTAAAIRTAGPWVPVDDTAAHIVVARGSVYRWSDSECLPAHRFGKLWKFRLSEIDDWVQADGANDAHTRAKTVRPGTTRKNR
jgi:excisionase family DNA binding protein